MRSFIFFGTRKGRRLASKKSKRIRFISGKRTFPDGGWEERAGRSAGKQEADFFVVGVDEVGRGALAGPVTAACVVFSPPVTQFSGYGLTDSKLLTREKRDVLSDWILQKALYTGLGWASVEEVETLNIRQASLLAMRRALQALPTQFFQHGSSLVVLDGMDLLPDFPYPQEAVVGGDRLILSVAAASVLAKVTRDRHMVGLDAQIPEYRFSEHKGYGTAEHREAIRRFGPSPHHRIRFCRKILHGSSSSNPFDFPGEMREPLE